MKTIFAVIIILVMAVPANAVSLVCDKQAGVDYYVVNGLPASIPANNIPLDTTYGFKLNIDSIPVGTYTLTAQACSNLWGCSVASVPLDFTRPVALATPGGLGLIK